MSSRNHHCHKKQIRKLFAPLPVKDTTSMGGNRRQQRRGIQTNLRADYDEYYYDDYDYDYDDYDYEEEEEEEGNNDQLSEYTYPKESVSSSSMVVNLWSVHQAKTLSEQQKKKQHQQQQQQEVDSSCKVVAAETESSQGSASSSTMSRDDGSSENLVQKTLLHRLGRSDSCSKLCCLPVETGNNPSSCHSPPPPRRRRRRHRLLSLGGEQDKDQMDHPQQNNPFAVNCPRFPNVHCLQRLLPSTVIPSVLGPSPRASHVVVSTHRRAAVALLWNLDSTSSSSLVRVVPLVGCGGASNDDDDDNDTTAESWATATRMQDKMQRLLSNNLGQKAVNDDDSPSYAAYLCLTETVAAAGSTTTTTWQQVLEESLPPNKPSLSTNNKKQQFLHNACVKAGMFVGDCYDLFDIFQLWLNAPPSHQDEESPLADANSSSGCLPSSPRTCLACFDTVNDDTTISQLLPCGHVTCSDCWSRYLVSAAGSGQGFVRCAAHKCNVRVGIMDAAHIFFFNNHNHHVAQQQATNTTVSNHRRVFANLVRFELEKSLPRLLSQLPSCQKKSSSSSSSAAAVAATTRKPRFCPTPCCGRILVPSNVEGTIGRNLMVCHGCGEIQCGECLNGGPSHPGMSCKAFQQMRKEIDTGRLDAELANVQWVVNHTRPCPKCRFPIQKNGGCNHVRCQTCDYYFCWQCGGEGVKCLAYQCHKKNRFWEDDNESTRTKHTDMANLVEKYRAYRHTDSRLKALKQSLLLRNDDDQDHKAGGQRNDSLLEVQMLQVLLWLHAGRVQRAMAHPTCKAHQSEGHLQLELALHALSLRKLAKKRRPKPSEVAGLREDEIALVFGVGGGAAAVAAAARERTLTRKPKTHLKQKKTEMAAGTRNKDRWEGNGEAEEFRSIFADQELADFLKMSDTQFLTKSREVALKAVQTLQKPTKVQESKRRKNRKNKTPLEGPLNQRGKRGNEPWRNGYRSKHLEAVHLASDGDEERDSSWDDDDQWPNSMSKQRWKKGKSRARQLRAHHFDVNLWAWS